MRIHQSISAAQNQRNGMIGVPCSRRALLLGTIGGLSPLGVWRPGRAEDLEQVSIALDWYPNSNHAGLFRANAAGFFAAAGIEVDLVIPADPTTVLQTVAAGRDTFGMSYQPDIFLARAEGLPIVALSALVPRPLLGVMSLKSSGITRPADLAGKVVGYTGIPSQEAFLTTMLESDGLTIDDITLNNIEFNLLPTLISGQAAAVMGAYWTHETIVAEREGYAVDLMRVDDWGVPLYNELVLVASEETAASRSETVLATLDAVRKGYLAAAGDQQTALADLTAAYPETDLDVETAGIALLADLWTQPYPGFGVIDPRQWQAFTDWMIASTLLPADFVLEGTISTLAAVPDGTATPPA